jgi:transcriptional regulator with XRE-family HTH domain
MEMDCRARRILAANVRRLRDEHGLSQRQLSNRAGIDRSYLARLENEALNISIDVFLALAKTLDINPCELFEEEHLDEAELA